MDRYANRHPEAKPKDLPAQRLGLLGGSFDPIHLGHINMGLRALEEFKLDKVFYITAKNSPFKINKSFLDSEKRHQLVEKALRDYPSLIPSRIELDRDEEVSYTYQTIEEYKKLYPEAELFLLMGEDAFASLTKWKNFDWIIHNIQFIVFRRGGLEFEIPEKAKVYFVKDFDFPISSSELREQNERMPAQ